MVLIGWLLALTSALCYGVASALQAVAARDTAASAGMDAMVLVRALRHWRFVAGLALDGLGFIAQVLALQILPLFVVQVVQASNLAVTALVAVPLLHIRLRGAEWAAVGAVCGGLLLLGLASGRQGEAHQPAALPWVLVVAAVLAGVVGWWAGRWQGNAGAAALGTLAGIEFTVVAVAARLLTSVAPLALLRDPAAWALAAGGVVGFLFFTTGLQRGAVTTVTGAVVVAETVLPAAVGVWLLGDRARPGLAPLAMAGFLVAVAGAVTLARFGEVQRPAPDAASG